MTYHVFEDQTIALNLRTALADASTHIATVQVRLHLTSVSSRARLDAIADVEIAEEQFKAAVNAAIRGRNHA